MPSHQTPASCLTHEQEEEAILKNIQPETPSFSNKASHPGLTDTHYTQAEDLIVPPCPVQHSLLCSLGNTS
ncbi:hypothetical protein Pmani_000048 [Petrolisthes manimaculis]|uniref:Uncharacterized protein n=1 Tax=Petrolisthes manimaculis TaxID=1843537 RepID=A0AAE1UQR9_9EUCA|nr:hypothetical protein Pmani_000048 [Petrolisthes manimaculis]